MTTIDFFSLFWYNMLFRLFFYECRYVMNSISEFFSNIDCIDKNLSGFLYKTQPMRIVQGECGQHP